MNLLIKHALLTTLIFLLAAAARAAAQTPTKEAADVMLRVALNDGTGNVAKGFGSLARSCAIENGEWVNEGLDGTCLKLSGADSGIDLGELSLAVPFTFSCWLSPGAETVDMRLLGTRHGQPESVMALSLNYPAVGMISLWDGTRWCVVDPALISPTGSGYGEDGDFLLQREESRHHDTLGERLRSESLLVWHPV